MARRGKRRPAQRADRPGASKSTGTQPQRDPHHRGKQKPYEVVTCKFCGAEVKENWYVRHVRSNCKIGGRP